MSETPHTNHDLAPAAITLVDVRTGLDKALSDIAAYDTEAPKSHPIISPDVKEYLKAEESLPLDILIDYASVLKFTPDSYIKNRNEAAGYYKVIEELGGLSKENVLKLYQADTVTNPFRDMIDNQLTNEAVGRTYIGSTLDVFKKIYDAESTPAAVLEHPEDPLLQKVRTCFSGDGRLNASDLYVIDTKFKVQAQTQTQRVWFRNAVRTFTDVADPAEADSYSYQLSKVQNGQHQLASLIGRIRHYGADKLESIQRFANLSALVAYSDEQLDRMYKLSQGDVVEVDYLKNHDVIAMFINMEGDHNGTSAGVASRMDDEAERTLFFEVSHPSHVYHNLKKLHDMGISPTTLIFASHGNVGQFLISERPALDSEEAISHVMAVADQDLVDVQSAKAREEGDMLYGYDIAQANGLIRGIQRLMQPSRAIDDPDEDLGRKKIISLSCNFDSDTNRASLGESGELVPGDKTSLLRRLGEVLVERLGDQHVDIYGADISTNKQTRTKRGFHYNTNSAGPRTPYYASVLHVDGKDTQWHRLNEVKLRKG